MGDRSRQVRVTFNTRWTRENKERVDVYDEELEWGEPTFENVTTYIKSLFSSIGDGPKPFEQCAAAWECGEEEGRYHVQACFRTTNARKYMVWKEKLQEFFNTRIWCSSPCVLRCDTWNGAVKYCSKEDDPTFIEQLSLYNVSKLKPGRRTDIEDMHAVAKRVCTGEITLDQMYETTAGFAGMMKYGQNMQQYMERNMVQRDRITEGIRTRGIWFYGDTGEGKTYAAYQFALSRGYASDQIYWWPLHDNGWCDSYDNVRHKVIIMDELRADCGKHTSISSLCRLVDWTPTHLTRRGKPPIPMMAEWVIITGPEDPDTTYIARSHLGDSVDQVKRRFYVRKVVNQHYDPIDIDAEPLEGVTEA